MRARPTPNPKVKATAHAIVWLLTAPPMLKGTGLKTERPLNPLLEEDPPFRSTSRTRGVKMRGLDKYIPFPPSQSR